MFGFIDAPALRVRLSGRCAEPDGELGETNDTAYPRSRINPSSLLSGGTGSLANAHLSLFPTFGPTSRSLKDDSGDRVEDGHFARGALDPVETKLTVTWRVHRLCRAVVVMGG